MIQENKQLLLKDLCARLPYGVKILHDGWDFDKDCDYSTIETLIGIDDRFIHTLWRDKKDKHSIVEPLSIIDYKPYLRPLSSMTEEEAKEVSILYGIKDILSIKITDEYIDVVVDDGFCSTETRTIWYDEIISSIEIFDWCNKNHFDYRGLIPLGLAIEATEGMYKKGE